MKYRNPSNSFPKSLLTTITCSITVLVRNELFFIFSPWQFWEWDPATKKLHFSAFFYEKRNFRNFFSQNMKNEKQCAIMSWAQSINHTKEHHITKYQEIWSIKNFSWDRLHILKKNNDVKKKKNVHRLCTKLQSAITFYLSEIWKNHKYIKCSPGYGDYEFT